MAGTLKPGDLAEWNTLQGTTHGTIKKNLTEPAHIKSHEAAASPDHPEYLDEPRKAKGSQPTAAHTHGRYSLLNWGHEPGKGQD